MSPGSITTTVCTNVPPTTDSVSTTTGDLTTAPAIMLKPIEYTIAVAVGIAIIIVVLVLVVINVCSKNRRDEISLLEMPLSTLLITTDADDSSAEVSEALDVYPESGHVHTGAEAAPSSQNVTDAVESGRFCMLIWCTRMSKPKPNTDVNL